MWWVKCTRKHTSDRMTRYNLDVLLISDIHPHPLRLHHPKIRSLLISSSSLTFLSLMHTHPHTRTHSSSYLPLLCSGLSQPLLPLSSLLAEPLQQLQLLSAPVPLSDLKLIGPQVGHNGRRGEHQRRRKQDGTEYGRFEIELFKRAILRL